MDLINAIYSRDINKVRAEIKAGADVNGCKRGGSPLRVAASIGSTEIVKVLLESGADINKCGYFSQGNTPLVEAVQKGHKHVVTQLITAGADVNAFGEGNKMPLGMAVFQDYLDIVKILLQSGADINMCDDQGYTALAYAAEKRTSSILRHLLIMGADVNKSGEKCTKPLMLAATSGIIENVKILVENGADIMLMRNFWESTTNRFGEAWIIAYLKKQAAFVKEKATKIALKTKTFSNWIKTNDLEMVKTLIANAANVNKPEDNGESPLVCAVKTGTLQMTELLLNNGAKFSIPSAFLAAIIANKVEIVQLLIKSGADVNVQYKDGNTPLLQAIEANNLKIAQLLIENGADVNLITDNNQDTALLRAASRANFQMFDYLLKAGGDLDQVKEKLDELADNNEDFAVYLKSVQKQKIEKGHEEVTEENNLLPSGAGSNQEQAPL